MNFDFTDLHKLLLAVLIGGVIGLEREFRGKAAGFRTIILITVGSSLFAIFSFKLVAGNDVDRIAANLVVGIGFLGAGTIFKDENRIQGLTTASTIWTSAALGLGVGAGYWTTTIEAAAIILIVLIFLPYVERLIDYAVQVRTYRIVCPYTESLLENYEALFKKYHLRSYSIKKTITDGNISASWTLSGRQKNHRKLIKQLLIDRNIKQLDF
jgi:putative Mg2+ transporter-C (MgtC) family protein